MSKKILWCLGLILARSSMFRPKHYPSTALKCRAICYKTADGRKRPPDYTGRYENREWLNHDRFDHFAFLPSIDAPFLTRSISIENETFLSCQTMHIR